MGVERSLPSPPPTPHTPILPMSALPTRLRAARRPACRAALVARYYALGLLKRLFTTPVALWAQAIAFKVLVTLLPLILLATGIFGLVLRLENPFETVAGFLRSFLPPNQSEQVVEMLFELQQTSGALTTVGAAAFVLTVVTLFGTLRYVIGQAMGHGRHTPRSIHVGYLFDVRMTLQAGGLFLASFALTFTVNVLHGLTSDWANDVGLDVTLLDRAWGLILRALVLFVPYMLSLAMFAQLYYFIPRPRPPLRSAFVGAAVTAVLFEAAKNGFTLYARYLGDFSRPGASAGEGLGSLSGIFGLILALVFWVYLSGLLIIVGAMVVALHERRLGPRRTAAHVPALARPPALRRLWQGVRRRVPGRARAPAPAP